jgi:serine/threonine-protein kinase HipA
MIFNVLGRNQDDHTKNITFLMSEEGKWSLSPGYDITFAYNPTGAWTSEHQMTINGKRDNFDVADFRAVAKRFRVGSASKISNVLAEIDRAVGSWPELGAKTGITESRIAAIQQTHRRLNRLHPAVPSTTIVARSAKGQRR